MAKRSEKVPTGYMGAVIGRSDIGPVNKPIFVKREGQLIVNFGGPLKSGYLGHAVLGYLENRGPGCYVVNVEEESVVGYEAALKALDKMGDIAFIIAPGQIDKEIQEAIVAHCEEKGDRIAILDVPIELMKEEEEPEEMDEEQSDLEADVESVALEEEGKEVEESGEGSEEIETEEEWTPMESEHCLYYYPWVTIWDYKLGYADVPPSGHVLAHYVRTARRQKIARPEVHGEITGTKGLEHKPSDEEIESLTSMGVEYLDYISDAPPLIGIPEPRPDEEQEVGKGE
ncbi:MAG: hypothetical protein ACE5G7_03550, partial [Candidatus Hydrothermarchaeaceae archaeon]